MRNERGRLRKKQAVVLLSGGLDSATALYYVKRQGFVCRCLIFDYGQRHHREIEAAKRIARAARCSWDMVRFALPWKGSSLLDRGRKLPVAALSGGRRVSGEIPDTYVPGRNIIFLSFALSFAESIGADILCIGAHAQDYSGYPDCRPEFYRAFSKVILTGTKAGVEKKGIKVTTPLLNKSKAQIIRMGKELGVPFGLTWSCYRGGKKPCGVCESCYFRKKGFQEAGLKDSGAK